MTSNSATNPRRDNLDSRDEHHRPSRILSLDTFPGRASQITDQELADDTNRRTDHSTKTPDEAQLRHELTLAYTDLGAAAFALAHHNSLHDPRLATRLKRIYELDAQIARIRELTKPTLAAVAIAPVDGVTTARASGCSRTTTRATSECPGPPSACNAGTSAVSRHGTQRPGKRV